MRKIPTILVRGDDGLVTPDVVPGCEWAFENWARLEEKIDGTNVRLTVRNETLVRVEKRRNPKKDQKKAGIVEPWYVDASDDDPNDKWIMEAARNTYLGGIPDGEWSAEAFGKKIQGNRYQIDYHCCCIFSAGRAPSYSEMKHRTIDNLAVILENLFSMVNIDVHAEGLIFVNYIDGRRAKIKRKDFGFERKSTLI